MSIDLTEAIIDHELTLMPGSPARPSFFGWIRLLNGNRDAGYVNLIDIPERPHLSRAKEYILNSVPLAMLQTMHDVLRQERIPQILFAAADDQDPDRSVFIESRPHEGANVTDARNKHSCYETERAEPLAYSARRRGKGGICRAPSEAHTPNAE